MNPATRSKILIVEDETIVALDIKRRLEKLGYQVTGMAARAHQAMALLEEQTPDIVLMDIQLNDRVDGIDIANSINQLYCVPVIFVTAYSEDATMGRASQARPYGYLLKPFSERDLHAVIKMSLERAQWDRELQRREAHLRLAIDAANMGVWETREDADHEIVLANLPLEDMDHIRCWRDFRELITDSDRPRVDAAISALANGQKPSVEMEFEIKGAQDKPCFFVLYGIANKAAENQTRELVGVIQDITDRKLAERELTQAAMVFNTSSEAIVITDRHLNVTDANTAFYRITRMPRDEVIGHPLELLSDENIGRETRLRIVAALAQGRGWQGEVQAYRRDDKPFPALVNISRVTHSTGTEWQYVVLISDISEIRRAQAELAYIAYYDSLTGLPNRYLFMDRLKMAMAHTARSAQSLAILFIDLDHFKRVNDTLGHQVGDQMLRGIADRMRPILRSSDTLCRLGGDEFIVIVDNFSDTDDLEVLCQKIIDAVGQPMLLANTTTTPSCSIGISLYPADARDLDDLVKMADTAMYSAKNLGRGRHAFYQPRMTTQVAHYLNREQELRRALQEGQFILHYQPVFNAHEQGISGVEALIRWEHPHKGLLSAAEVIPMAETCDLIIDIGEWVIDEACRQYRTWAEDGVGHLRVAVNVSVRQLQHPGFVKLLADTLERHEMPGERLELEVTESSLQNSEASITALRRIQSLGVTVSIDDFGTGYSCMSSLKLLPIHRLKIDQSFVRDIPGQSNDCAIATAIIVLAHELGLQVIAEGIETPEQRDFLKQAGADEMQGYFFSRPIPARQVGEFVKQ